MYNLFIAFEATLDEPKYEAPMFKIIKTDFLGFSKVLQFQFSLSSFPVQTSEFQYIARISDTRIRVEIQSSLKKLSNYHHAASLFQGYFGLIGSLPYLHSDTLAIGTF